MEPAPLSTPEKVLGKVAEMVPIRKLTGLAARSVKAMFPVPDREPKVKVPTDGANVKLAPYPRDTPFSTAEALPSCNVPLETTAPVLEGFAALRMMVPGPAICMPDSTGVLIESTSLA